MALITCQFTSAVLGMETTMTVILPQPAGHIACPADGYPTLYLLHGRGDNDTAWLRRTSIERYVSGLQLAVVMPQVHLSFYTDMICGNKYWTFLSEELPRIARSFFPLSVLREDNFVAGLSMGGYGAFKWALRKPEMFAAAASLSGGVNIANPECANLGRDVLVRLVFGQEDFRGTDNDLFHLVKCLDEKDSPVPLLYQCCGTEDPLYRDNLIFRDTCRKTRIPLTYEEEPGTHEWGYWDKKIKDVLKWLPLGGRS